MLHCGRTAAYRVGNKSDHHGEPIRLLPQHTSDSFQAKLQPLFVCLVTDAEANGFLHITCLDGETATFTDLNCSTSAYRCITGQLDHNALVAPTMVLSVPFLDDAIAPYQVVALAVVVVCIYGLALASLRKNRLQSAAPEA